MDAMTLGGHEPLVRVPEREATGGEVDPLDRMHGLGDAHEQIDLLAQRNREGILAIGSLIGGFDDRDVGQVERRSGHQGRCLGYVGCFDACGAGGGFGKVGYRVEAPRRADQRPDPESQGVLVIDILDGCVLDVDHLGASGYDACVRISGAGRHGGIDRLFCVGEQGGLQCPGRPILPRRKVPGPQYGVPGTRHRVPSLP